VGIGWEGGKGVSEGGRKDRGNGVRKEDEYNRLVEIRAEHVRYATSSSSSPSDRCSSTMMEGRSSGTRVAKDPNRGDMD
jgi:hypothetical protein